MTELSTNARMAIALAKPLAGQKQIKPLILPKPTMPVREWVHIFTCLDADFALWLKKVGRDVEIDPK